MTQVWVAPVAGAGAGTARQYTRGEKNATAPEWSPDGKTIAFASDRGQQTDFENLKFSRWQITLYDLESGRVSVLAQQAGQNLNPMWAPDGRSLAFVSDRSGVSDVFLYRTYVKIRVGRFCAWSARASTTCGT